MHSSVGARPALAVVIGLGLLGGGFALSQVAEAGPLAPAATSAPSVIPTTAVSQPTASSSSVPSASASASPSARRTPLPKNCPVDDAEIQMRFPSATMQEVDGGHNWYVDGKLVGRTVRGSGWDLSCPVS